MFGVNITIKKTRDNSLLSKLLYKFKSYLFLNYIPYLLPTSARRISDKGKEFYACIVKKWVLINSGGVNFFSTTHLCVYFK